MTNRWSGHGWRMEARGHRISVMRSSRFQLNRARWDAAAQAAAVIARAMRYRAGPPPLPDEADENARESNWSHGETTRASPTGPRKPVRPTVRRKPPDRPDPEGGPGEPARRLGLDWLGDDPTALSPGTTAKDTAEPACPMAGSGFERARGLVSAYAGMFSSLRGHVPTLGGSRPCGQMVRVAGSAPGVLSSEAVGHGRAVFGHPAFTSATA